MERVLTIDILVRRFEQHHVSQLCNVVPKVEKSKGKYIREKNTRLNCL